MCVKICRLAWQWYGWTLLKEISPPQTLFECISASTGNISSKDGPALSIYVEVFSELGWPLSWMEQSSCWCLLILLTVSTCLNLVLDVLVNSWLPYHSSDYAFHSTHSRWPMCSSCNTIQRPTPEINIWLPHITHPSIYQGDSSLCL